MTSAFLGLIALAAAVVFVVVATVLAAVRPLIINRRTSTRPPTNTEGERFVSGVDGGHRVRLRIAERSPDAVSARARALGILPGYQYVFVVDQLLTSLSAAAGRAVIAHEIGHHRGWHPLVRVGLPAVALIAWPLAIAGGIPYALVGGTVVLPLYVLLVCYIERGTEYRADEYAAEQVGYGSMIRALEYLDETDADQERSRVARLLATRPSVAERIARLEGLAEDPEADDESRGPE